MAKGKKTGGRKAGTPNKTPKMAKEGLARIVSEDIDGLAEWLKSLPDEVRYPFEVRYIFPYILPKQSEQTFNVGGDTVDEIRQQMEQYFK